MPGTSAARPAFVPLPPCRQLTDNPACPPPVHAPRSFGQAGGIPRRLCPILTGLREEVTSGQYTLVRPRMRWGLDERRRCAGACLQPEPSLLRMRAHIQPIITLHPRVQVLEFATKKEQMTRDMWDQR